MGNKVEPGQSNRRLGLRTPDFEPLTAEEASRIRGGAGVGAGTCAIVGYACYCKGGFGFGVCLLAGYSTSVQRGS